MILLLGADRPYYRNLLIKLIFKIRLRADSGIAGPPADARKPCKSLCLAWRLHGLCRQSTTIGTSCS